MKKIAAILMSAMLMLTSMCVVFAEETTVTPRGENVALNKPVTANSEHVVGYYPASRLTNGGTSGDGNQWCAYYPQTTSYDYAIVDLGEQYPLNAIVVYMCPTYSTSEGEVYVSNDKVDWTHIGNVAATTGAQALAVDTANKWQYVKIQGKQVSGNLFAVYELEAYYEKIVELKGENVAKGKTVTASASHQWYPAGGMVDGNFSDSGIDGAKWRTPDGTVSDGQQVYAIIDLGQAYTINAVKGEVWSGSYSTNANALIYGSVDGTEYNDLLATISSEGVQTAEVVSETKYRYIKVQGRDWPGLGWGVWELEVYSEDKEEPPVVEPVEPQGENVALKKSVTANSEHPVGYYPANRLTDGNSKDDGNRWCAAYPQTTNYDYAIVDLGKQYSINAISAYLCPQYSTSEGEIYVSNDKVAWTHIGNVAAETGCQTLGVDPSAMWRYVKIQGKQVPGNLFSVWELEVYSTDKFTRQGDNVAKGKPVETNYAHEWYPGSKLVDGNFSDSGEDAHRWTSPGSNDSAAKEIYAIIDLGKPYSINALVGEIVWNDYATKGAATIYGSNDPASFTEILGTISGEGKKTVEVFAEGKYQYIKVSGKDWPGLNWGMWELEVYSSDDYLACETTYVVSDEDMTEIEAIPASGTFAVKVNYSTNGGRKDLVGYLVEYGSGKTLEYVSTVDIPVGANEQNGEIVVYVSVGENTESFRFFVWDKNNRPYTEAKAIAK